MEALLTADLLENKRLSTETFIELQNEDSSWLPDNPTDLLAFQLRVLQIASF